MISHRHECIFIHIPKCAGTTVEQYFEKLGVAGTASYHCRLLGGLRTRVLARAINLYPHYFTFTFVRNPFDRFISCYFFGLMRGAKFLGYENLQEFTELCAELLTLGPRWDEDPERKIGPHQTPARLLKHYVPLHSRRQIDFLLEYNPSSYFGVPRLHSAPCSFVGRRESFDKDFARLLHLLDAPLRPLNSFHVREGGPHPHYSHYYDKATRRQVEELYARDLEVLGYEFEQEGAVGVLSPLYDLEEARTRRRHGAELSLHQRAQVCIGRLWLYAEVYLYLRSLSELLAKIRKTPRSQLYPKARARVERFFQGSQS